MLTHRCHIFGILKIVTTCPDQTKTIMEKDNLNAFKLLSTETSFFEGKLKVLLTNMSYDITIFVYSNMGIVIAVS